jgi:hypothetical protein
VATPTDTAELTGRLAVIRLDEEFRLCAARPVVAGERLFTIEGDLTSVPTRYSVQVGRSTHVDLPGTVTIEEILDKYYWRFMNHGCEPNVAIRGREVHSLRALRQWDEITFDYNTTEYDIAEPFDCRCGSAGCVGRVRGFRYLSRPERERLRPYLAAHLRSVLDGDDLVAGRGQGGQG